MYSINISIQYTENIKIVVYVYLLLSVSIVIDRLRNKLKVKLIRQKLHREYYEYYNKNIWSSKKKKKLYN